MGHGRHKGFSRRRAPVVPVADYNVTNHPGFPTTPDCTCNYFVAGVHNGKPYYRREDGAFFIWWRIVNVHWTISENLGIIAAPFWHKIGPDIDGLYTAILGCGGVPVVAAGPH